MRFFGLFCQRKITVCGGREKNLRDLQSWMFFAGANGTMIGNYLTTTGRDEQQDRQMLQDLGLTIVSHGCEMKCWDRKDACEQEGYSLPEPTPGSAGPIVAAAIALYRERRNRGVAVLKPVTSGAVVIDGRLCSEDAELLRWASRCTAPDADIAPYLLREPLTHHQSPLPR
ncbi:MAG: hypothetical protein MZV70_73520 [Desulfobacterales bacterium]|nr:hypothetical protein [Desulfobacterales bacterium]